MHKNTKTLLYILYLLIALPVSGAVFGFGLRVWAPIDWVDCALYTLAFGVGGVLFALRKERAREAFLNTEGAPVLKWAVGSPCQSSYCL
ncbi:MAG: hypothetical protein DYG89_38555 [Caldilinea sp. CFX5]|nr:hypothetical protein [Caldilinea sp. CFX5]